MAEDTKPVEDIRVGDLITLIINDDERTFSNVSDMRGDTIWVADIMRDIIKTPWHDRAFDIQYLHNGRCFTFLVEVEGKDQIDNLAYTRLRRVSPVKETQRRQSFRLPDMFSVFMRLEDSDDVFTECQGVDISEKGAGIVAEGGWDVGDRVECKFELAGVKYQFLAKIRRCVRDLCEGTHELLLGVEFMTALDGRMEQQMQKLRKYVFKQQIERNF